MLVQNSGREYFVVVMGFSTLELQRSLERRTSTGMQLQNLTLIIIRLRFQDEDNRTWCSRLSTIAGTVS